MKEGTVKWFSEEKGFGFISPENGKQDIFVHISDVRKSGYETLHEKDIVEYEIKEDHLGRQRAHNLTTWEPAA